ncbi:MAG: hypothetical protein J6Z38_04565 [Lachnospiraceae bacterium]|nr:hypothetical protein [Lachnospiraceae bacterium]
MKKLSIPALILCVLMLAGTFACLFFADRIQRDNGNIEISTGVIESDAGDLAYKLYKPKNVFGAPGVLLLHGYQNDHETCAAYAIELARRGVVVLAIDEYGHGDTVPGLLSRGYVNQRVKVNFGEDSVEDKTFVTVGGPVRYRIMMNFSNLSFFDERYTKDADGNVLTDSSCGGIAAYAYLASLPYVDDTRLGLSGHSMGTWSSWSVAAAYAGTPIEPKATVLQCGELFRDSAYDTSKYHFNNVLLLQAKWDEFSYFRDYKLVVDDSLLKSDLRTEFLGTTAEKAAWNTTYGSFADGTARRMELLYTNHRLTTHNAKGLQVALDWFADAMGYQNPIAPADQTAMTKEWLVLGAMLLALFSLLPLFEVLEGIPFFNKASQPLPPKEDMKKGGKWWKGAVITMLLAGLTYPFMTQLGHGLLPLPENVFRMTVGNGFVSWYGLLIIIMIVTTVISFSGMKKAGLGGRWYRAGLGSAEKPDRLSFSVFFRSLLRVLAMLLYLYLIVFLADLLFKLDLRFIWPFFRPFSLMRLGQFAVYFPIFALFFILNNSKIMASMRTEASYKKGLAGFLGTWLPNALLMVGGVLLIVLIEYIPFFLNIGPGADVLFSSTFGGPFMSLLILFVPQVIVFSVLCTYCYRRTGSVYTGALLVSALAAWIVTGGSSFL